MHQRSIVIVVLAVCLAGGDRAWGLASAAQRQEHGDTVVKQAGTPRHAGVAQLAAELSIGRLDGPPEFVFESITDVAVKLDGAVLVLETGGTPMVREYDRQGRYVRSIGRRGRGPGEYLAPSGIAVLPDGRILVLDGGNRRINVYSAAAEPITSWSLADHVIGIGGGGGLSVAPNGTVAVRVTILNASAATAMERMLQRRSAIVRLSADGEIIDTLFEPHLDVSDATVSKASLTSFVSIEVPYMPTAVTGWSPRGYWITGVNARYAFELRQPRAAPPARWRAGDPLLSIRRSVAPVPVSNEERADRRKYVEQRLAASTGTVNRSVPEIPRQKPAYRGFLAGDDGRVWVALSTRSVRYDPETEPSMANLSRVGGGGGQPGQRLPRPTVPTVPWREPALYDVFEPDGTWIGQVAVPYNVRLLRTSGDTAWAVARDDLEVEYLRRFRIAWSS